VGSLISTKLPLISELNSAWWPPIQAVFFDIDDTFSTHGKITSEAYSALWRLYHAGFVLVPVTGRPAGWCDHIARFWPVHAVVGENGAFLMMMVDGKLKTIHTLSDEDSKAARGKLGELKTEILSAFPKARLASDQDFRWYDLAIDTSEDVSPWSEEEIDRLVEFCELKGSHAKVSSIHVNTWFGDYSKKDGLERALKELQIHRSIALSPDDIVFLGDSPNDEPLFAAMPKSIGVANLRRSLHRLKSPPSALTPSESGAGFAEVAEILLQQKR
jgi:HAD superfamily hydrolase (TIGR01484 family)